MSGRKIGEFTSHDWRRNRNIATAIEFPDFLAGCEIVSAGVMPAIHKNLRLDTDSRDRRRAPRWHIFARRLPKLLAVCQSVHGKKGILLHVAQDDNFVLVN